ncbi:hypothetical protein DH2020_046179 [Rehmannia glutinosa]|uniref:Magnesium transporter n=1 Tax=Rehmannia glutinosa TaxID=99300 RepID=A0ABR0UBZ7_REHGL
MAEEEEDEFIVETQMSFKKKGAVSRNWISLDSSGQGIILDLDKYDIMKRVQINARDLRILDPLLSYPSAILARGKIIVLNLEHIKAIITTDEVLLRDPLDDNVMPIVEELQRRLPLAIGRGEGEEEELSETRNSEVGTNEETDFPFEFRALEVALEGVCSSLDAQTRELEVVAYPALDELTAKVRDELEQLLDDDDDMADLYLSRKSAMSASVSSDYGHGKWQITADESPTMSSNISRSSSRASALTTTQEENNVEELEMLLELREYIDDTEDYINIQLELFLSSGTVCLSMYSLVAAIFGMNIPYPWRESHGHLFKWVILLTTLACGSFFLSIITYARHKGLVGS